MSSSEQDGDSSTGQPTTSDNKIPVKEKIIDFFNFFEKMKNTNVSQLLRRCPYDIGMLKIQIMNSERPSETTLSYVLLKQNFSH